MGRGDNRRTYKMRRRAGQRKKLARLQRKMESGKAEKK